MSYHCIKSYSNLITSTSGVEHLGKACLTGNDANKAQIYEKLLIQKSGECSFSKSEQLSKALRDKNYSKREL